MALLMACCVLIQAATPPDHLMNLLVTEFNLKLDLLSLPKSRPCRQDEHFQRVRASEESLGIPR